MRLFGCFRLVFGFSIFALLAKNQRNLACAYIRLRTGQQFDFSCKIGIKYGVFMKKG
jgi:hypothetical protein